jgi:hypothetical protein
MSTDWLLNWTFNDSNFIFDVDAVSIQHNFPTVERINPHATIVYKIRLVAPLKVRSRDISNLRFGFVYFDANKIDGEEYRRWLDAHNIALEYDHWRQVRNRSKSEIKEWIKEHGFKTREDKRVIWERWKSNVELFI